MERQATPIPLIIVLLVAAALRLAWGLFIPSQLDPRLGDQADYLQIGRNLLAHGEFKTHDARFDQDAYASRPPGYPVLVAACGGNVRAVRVVQSLLDTSTVLAVYLLARRFLNPWPSLAAAAFVAVNPFLIYFTGLILTETLFTAMLAWGMYLLYDRRHWLVWMGLLLLAFSALVRPSGLGLIMLLAAAAAWKESLLAIGRNVSLAALLTVVVLFPWAYRNAHHPQLQAWIWTTTAAGITTYDGFHHRATGASDQSGFLHELRTPLSRMDEVERDAFLGQQAHAWIRTHPARSLELMAIKIGRTWSPIPLSNEYGGNRVYVAVGLLYTLPFDLLVLLGLWKSAIPRSAKVFLLLPAIYFTVIHALSVGSLRYRIPVEPPMAVMAGAGVYSAFTARHGPTNGPSRRKSG